MDYGPSGLTAPIEIHLSPFVTTNRCAAPKYTNGSGNLQEMDALQLLRRAR